MRRLTQLALVALLLALGAGDAVAADVPAGYEYHDEFFDSGDGTRMHAGVYLPRQRPADGRVPLVMVISPYTQHNGGVAGGLGLGLTDPTGRALAYADLFTKGKLRDRGYGYVQVDVRGFGGSGGCFEFYGPREQADAKAAIEWAAGQQWSSGRVGLFGISYEGAQQVLALGARPKGLAAAIVQQPGLSAYTALWMNRNHYFPARYGTSSTYVLDDLVPGANLTSPPEYLLNPATGMTAAPACQTDAIAQMNVVRDRDSDFWRGREVFTKAIGSTTPVLWSHGFQDANTKPVHMPIWNGLAGPKRAWFGQYTHVATWGSAVGRSGFLDEAMAFLDEHVRGVPDLTLRAPVTVQEGNGKGRWRAEERWPPADLQDFELPLRAGSYRDMPGNHGEGDATGAGRLWSSSAPLDHPAHLAGEPRLRARLTTLAPEVNTVAHLYDVDPKGSARLVTRGAATIPLMGEQEVDFRLYPQDWRFDAGHRIALVVSGSDDDWFTPGITFTDVAVAGGAVDLPLLGRERTALLKGAASAAIADDLPFTVSSATLGPPTTTAAPAPMAPAARALPRRRGRAIRSVTATRSGAGNTERLVVAGRARRGLPVLVEVRLGGVLVAQRTVRAVDGRFAIEFATGGIAAGPLEIVARARGARRAMRLP